MRWSMLFNSKNKNESDPMVYLQNKTYTLLGRFDQTESHKTKCQKKLKWKKRGRSSDEIQGVRTGLPEPVFRISPRSVNPFIF